MSEQTHNVVSGQPSVGHLVKADEIGTVHIHGARTLVHHPSFELPPEKTYFVGRANEQQRISETTAAGDSEGSYPRIFAVRGPGETALCVRVGHRLADSYPDGVYYLDLDGDRHDGGIDLFSVVTGMLLALGVEPEWLRNDYRGRIHQFRKRTRGKRLLMIIDNARTASEVEPLLPASAYSLVLVTSRNPLGNLAAIEELVLAPLSAEHVAELLHLLLGKQPHADPAVTKALAAVCDGLPMAVEVVGGLLRKYSRRSPALLAKHFAAALHEHGSTPMKALWDVTFAELSPGAALLYHLLPECPGPFVVLSTAAALLGRDLFYTEDALAELSAAGLLDYRFGRYYQHPLVRDHVRQTARAADSERAAARARLLHWLRRQCARADLLAAGPRATVQVELPPLSGVPDADLGAAKADALRWMEANRHALYGAVGLAYASHRDEDAVALAESLWTHFLDHPRHKGMEFLEHCNSAAVEAFRVAVLAADRSGHRLARIRTRDMLARSLWEQGRFGEATALVEKACELARSLDSSYEHCRMVGSAIEFRGQLALAYGRYAAAQGRREIALVSFADARADFTASREIQWKIGNVYGATLQTYQLAKTAAAAADASTAAKLFAKAHAYFTVRPGRERMTARTSFGLARALRQLGRHEAAEPLLTEALTAATTRGSSYDEARIRTELAALADATGHPTTAAHHRSRAAALRAEKG
ncbi:tetratricopeptide repeat protein [Kitasatospora sp. YST-16]|uniref:tetratricopeptide repeat protein n=1 Tax=Kitasatospora sp. YST-16 TaxID=2998080 RepID=UPI0022835D7B|nr:tetratricopeptide repeat protein [Kitasatospora sp. YST-16]WAL75429.1 tetratricopeptide repeat protein [Kitasatospora sp. YST-16]WNW41489.1 tetratricopeptide repeat protein [Streptomyces sp. Li-HN-5-13]